MSYRNLLIGCGHARDKRLEPAMHLTLRGQDFRKPRTWRGELDTLDYQAVVNPTHVWDLNVVPWCQFPDNHYDEVHAYEVLEHLGRLGDFRAFFETFAEAWRILKPGGFLCATVPSRKSQWALGDPGHTRVILPCTLVFLDQQSYRDQQGRTTMTDYRDVYRADLETIYSYDNAETHQFILRAVKPSRCPDP